MTIVKSLYSNESQAIRDMHDYTKRKLKDWEKQVVSQFPPGARILDIGCGMGREAFCLHELGFQVTGIDLSEEAIAAAEQYAKAGGLAVKFLVTNGMDLPFLDSSFDIVIIWAQTFGLFYGEQNRCYILDECKRVLKGGGLLSFSVHDREYLENNYRKFLKCNRFYPYTDTECYWESFTIEEISQLSAKAGFHVLRLEKGSVYQKEDGTIIHCLCDRPSKNK